MIQSTVHKHNQLKQECFDQHRTFERPKINQNKKNVQQLNRFEEYLSITNKFAHHHLYCRNQDQILTVSESKVLSNQRNKYLQFVLKNYKYKLPQQFTSKKAMKQNKNTYLQKIKAEKAKKQAQDQLKPKKRARAPKHVDEPVGQSKKRRKVNQVNNQNKQAKSNNKQKNTKKKNEKVVKNVQQKDDQEQNQQNSREQNGIVNQDNFESDQNLKNQDLDAIDDDQQQM